MTLHKWDGDTIQQYREFKREESLQEEEEFDFGYMMFKCFEWDIQEEGQ